MILKDKMNIAVSSMTNADSFIREGAYEAMRRLKNAGASSVEVSQHIQFDEACVEQIVSAQKDFDMDICALSVRFNGTLPWKVPTMKHGDLVLKTYDAEADFEKIVGYCHRFGCNFVRFATIPGRQMNTMEEMKAYMTALEKCCRKYAAEGITLCVHNHADEFLKMEGTSILDWALDLAPHLGLEIDCLNVQKAGKNPAKLISRVGDRVNLLHLQDQRIAPPDSNVPFLMGPELYQGTYLGDGNLELEDILAAASGSRVKYLIIEQAKFYGEDPYDCIKKSVRYLNEHI